ncbi:hypothetical protein V8E55_007532 [Tylopilus felleus]
MSRCYCQQSNYFLKVGSALALSVTIIRHVWLLRSHTTPPANQLFLQDIPYRVLRACLIIFPTVYSNPLSVVFQIGHDFETCYNIVTQGPRLKRT